MEEMRKCSRCGRELPIGNFYSGKKKYKVCKECYKVLNHENYLSGGHKVTTLNKYRSKMNISSLAQTAKSAGIDMYGKELHHWNYNHPREVYVMSRTAHRKLHRFLRVDNDTNMVYTNDDLCLDTREKAENFYVSVFNKIGINEPLRLVSL